MSLRVTLVSCEYASSYNRESLKTCRYLLIAIDTQALRLIQNPLPKGVAVRVRRREPSLLNQTTTYVKAHLRWGAKSRYAAGTKA